jgi:DNA-binding transcriptional LysR family regulator
MSIKKYETLLKTVDLGSLTKASEVLGYTQSAISQIITGLEDEMGLKLLVRDRSGVRLTVEGKRLIPAIRMVCEANDEVFRQVAEIHGLEVGTIRIGTFLSVSVAVLPDMIREFSQQHPSIEFELLQGSQVEIERWIAEGRVDCGFLHLPSTQQLQTIPVTKEGILAIFPETRQMDTGPVSMAAIEKECFILQPDSVESGLLELLKKANCKPKITYSAKDDYAVMAMVEKGLGMSLLPELLLKRTHYKLKKRELDPPIQRLIYLAYKDKRSLSPAARQFIQCTREQYGEP